MKRGFTLVELLVVITIISILVSIGLGSFTTTQKKSRDAKRKAYLSQIAESLEAYYNDKGQYPADNDAGNLMACGVDAEEECTWGTSSMQNTTTGTVYIITLPQDPVAGHTYYYDANLAQTSYQLYAYLENERDPVLDLLTLSSPDCGTDLICNYGISSLNTTPQEGRWKNVSPASAGGLP